MAAVAVRGDRAALATVELSTGDVESLACARDQLGAALAAETTKEYADNEPEGDNEPR